MATRHDTEMSRFWEIDIDLVIISFVGNIVFMFMDHLHK